MHPICNFVTHIDLQRLLLLFYMQFFTKVDNHHLLPTEGYEVLFLPNHPGVGEHRYKKAWLYMRAAINYKRAFIFRLPLTAHSNSADHVGHVPEEDYVMTVVRKLLFVKAGFRD